MDKTTPHTITPGKLVRTDRPTALSGRCVTVEPDATLDRATVDGDAAAAGWQLASFDNTGALVFVRLTADRKWIGNLLVTRVDIADVDTVAVPYGDTFSIVAAVGAARPQGWTRSENARMGDRRPDRES